MTADKKLFTGYYAKHGKHPLAISISVVVPRWFPGMKHYAPLAPTWKLVEAYKMGTIGHKEYTKEYLGILFRRAKPAEQIIAEIPEGSVLLCYEKPPEFCHRHVAAEWLMKHGGVTIEEMS